MFAYCLNNPVNPVDPSGTIPYSEGFFDEDFRRIGEWFGIRLKEEYGEKYRKTQNLTYARYEEKEEAQITNSYQITNIFVMYEYSSCAYYQR